MYVSLFSWNCPYGVSVFGCTFIVSRGELPACHSKLRLVIAGIVIGRCSDRKACWIIPSSPCPIESAMVMWKWKIQTNLKINTEVAKYSFKWQSLSFHWPCFLVSSRLDYANSVFVGLSDLDLNRLKHIQNSLACVVLRVPLRTNSSVLLHRCIGFLHPNHLRW